MPANLNTTNCSAFIIKKLMKIFRLTAGRKWWNCDDQLLQLLCELQQDDDHPGCHRYKNNNQLIYSS